MAERERIETLAVACAAAGGGGAGPVPRPEGLLAELTDRPGRSVTVWIAEPVMGAPDTEAHDHVAGADNAAPCLGLVALVEAGGAGEAPVVNWSVAWLLVDPRHRRRGIARALVLVAVAAAVERGAVGVTAETRSDWTAARRFWDSIARAAKPPHDDVDPGGWDAAEERVS